MAHRVVEALMARHQVFWLQAQGPENWKTEQLNAEILVGEVTSPNSLRKAGAKDCAVFIACSNVDEQNIVACISAKRIGAKKTICVVNGRSFLTGAGETGEDLATQLGIDEVIRPIEQLADELIGIVLVPGALEVESLADGRLALFRYAVGEHAKSIGKNLLDLTLPDSMRLVQVRRGDELIVPRGDTVLMSGDKVIVMGTRDGANHLGSLFCDRVRTKREAAVIGGGRVGRAVTRGLMESGFRVTVVEANPKRCQTVSERTEALVLHGDGTDVEFLEQEHIGDKPVVIAVTDSDEKNLLVALVIKQLGTARVVTRADRLTNERLFEKVGVDVVRSAKGAAIRNILRITDESESQILAELEHGAACVLELTVDSKAKELSLIELAPPAYAVVGAILRGKETIIPSGRDSLRAGDHLFVFCASDDQEVLRDYFQRPEPSAQTE